MSGVGLIGKALIGDGYNPVEDSDFLGARATFPQSTPNFDFKAFLDLLLKIVEVLIQTQRCKVIPMNDAHKLSLFIPEDARVRLTSLKAQGFHHQGISILP